MAREVGMNKPGNYRQSLIATFDSCPLRARFSLEDTRRTPGALAARGTLLHRALHKAVRIMWANGETRMSVEQGMELLLEVLCQANVPSEEVVPLTMSEMRWARVAMVKWCENPTNAIDTRKILATEERLYADLKLPTGKTVRITGQIDLLLADPPDGLVVVDYKTGFRRPKATRDPEKAAREGTGLTELGWVQWLIYSFLGFENFPSVNRVVFRERHVLWDQERYARMERWEMERLVDVLAAQVALLDQAIDEGPTSERWVPSAGTHCALCANPRACPIMELEKIDLTTVTGRRRVAQEWVVATETRDKRREVLDGLVETYGPIEIPHALGRRVVGWDYDVKGKRNFGIFEPRDIPESPYDEALEAAARDAGVIKDG